MAKSKAKIVFVAPQLDEDGRWVFFVRESDGTERPATSNEIALQEKEFRGKMERDANNFQKMQERILADPDWRPPLNLRYLQYALWAEGRDSSYAPTLADALLNAVEHQKKVYGSNVGLKTTKVASSKATKSGTTQKRFIASKVYACPKCKSQKIKVQHTGKEQRKCRCFDCGKCFSKRIE